MGTIDSFEGEVSLDLGVFLLGVYIGKERVKCDKFDFIIFLVLLGGVSKFE